MGSSPGNFANLPLSPPTPKPVQRRPLTYPIDLRGRAIFVPSSAGANPLGSRVLLHRGQKAIVTPPTPVVDSCRGFDGSAQRIRTELPLLLHASSRPHC